MFSNFTQARLKAGLMREPVIGVKIEGDFWACETTGGFQVEEDGSRIKLVCPCGCGSFMNLPISRAPQDSHPSWTWDGNRDQPTLEPSIRDLGGCLFHGWLRAGVWTFAGDSGVKS